MKKNRLFEILIVFILSFTAGILVVSTFIPLADQIVIEESNEIPIKSTVRSSGELVSINRKDSSITLSRQQLTTTGEANATRAIRFFYDEDTTILRHRAVQENNVTTHYIAEPANIDDLEIGMPVFLRYTRTPEQLLIDSMIIGNSLLQ